MRASVNSFLFACSLGLLATGSQTQPQAATGSIQGEDSSTLRSLLHLRPSLRLDSTYGDDPKRILLLSDLESCAGFGIEAEGVLDGPGGGLDLRAGGLVIAGEALGLTAEKAWTLSFTGRFEDLDFKRKGALLRIPGLFKIEATMEGSLQVSVGNEPIHKGGRRDAFRVGVDHHVTVTWDPEVLLAMRVAVDGVMLGLRLDGVELKQADAFRIELASGGLPLIVGNLSLVKRAVPTNEVFRRTEQTLDSWEESPPLEQAIALPVAVLREQELERWGVTDHLVWVAGEALQHAPGQWRQLDLAPGPIPQARTTHTTLSIGPGRVLLFASEARDTHMHPMRNISDTWILDLTTESWSQVATGPILPEPRCHQTGAFDPEQGLLFYPGGFRNDIRPVVVHGDAWVLDVAEEEWTRVIEKSPGFRTLPDTVVFFRPKSSQFYTTVGSTIYRIGSTSGIASAPQEIQFFDAEGEQLFGISLGASPTTIYDPVSDRAVVFCGDFRKPDHLGPWEKGVDVERYFTNRTWILNPDTAEMRLVDSEQCFSPRVRPAAGLDGKTGRIIIYGGVRDQHSPRYGDLWSFDPLTEQWTEVRQSSDTPGPRGGFYGMPYDEKYERFVLTHGRSSGSRFHDDTWLLDFAPDAVGTGRWLFDRLGFPGMKRLVLHGTGDFRGKAEIVLRAGPSEDSLRVVGPELGSVFEAGDRFVEVNLRLIPTAADWGLLGIEFDQGAEAVEESQWSLVGKALEDS